MTVSSRSSLDFGDPAHRLPRLKAFNDGEIAIKFQFGEVTDTDPSFPLLSEVTLVFFMDFSK